MMTFLFIITILFVFVWLYGAFLAGHFILDRSAPISPAGEAAEAFSQAKK